MEFAWSWKLILDAATLLGIPSLILTIFFFVISRPKISIASRNYENLVIGSENAEIAEGLQVYYKDKKITSLSRTDIFFWNNGNRAFRGTDVARNDLIRITYAGGAPLSVKVLGSSSPSNAVRLVESGEQDCLAIDFDYLEPTEGFVVELLHEAELAIRVQGKIVGAVGSGVNDFSRQRPTDSAISKGLDTFSDFVTGRFFRYGRRYMLLWAFWTIYTFSLPLLFYFAPPPSRAGNIDPERVALTLFAALFFIWIVLSVVVWRRMRREPPGDLIGDVVPRR